MNNLMLCVCGHYASFHPAGGCKVDRCRCQLQMDALTAHPRDVEVDGRAGEAAEEVVAGQYAT